MTNNRIEMIVAQNCVNYNPRYKLAVLSMLSSSESCYNCKNFIDGKCTEELFDEIRDIISKN